ncbi:MAG: 3D domain-containing protein [Acidobacteria bacterium]|nr:3D domain-containing protein [Acidobacteriota bacterium]
MNSSDEKDRVWIFASTLFAIFLLLFSGLAIEYTSPHQEPDATVQVQETVEDFLVVTSPLAATSQPFKREFLATAYSDYGITKSGVLVAIGIVAADPNVLPIGSIIQVDAGVYSGIYTVMDTGGDVRGHKIDIFIPDYDEAVRFGMRKVAVRVLRHGWNPQGETPASG